MMATGATQAIRKVVQSTPPSREKIDLTDGELLDLFIDRGDAAAFEELLRRHGRMVLGVCRRTLPNYADAEDAFQATFLVLFRRAATVRPRHMVGNWLYGVARSTALKARVMSNRRLVREREAAAQARLSSVAETWENIQPVIDREIAALPDKYRAAIVLCDIEGKSLKEVARDLGCPLSTIGTRLARGRVMLWRRLASRGITVSASVLAFLLTQNAASAAVPSALVDSTAKASSHYSNRSTVADGAVSARVAGLATAVLNAMMLTRLRTALAVLIAIGAIAFAGLSIGSQWNDRFPPAQAGKTATVHERLQGDWVVVSLTRAGEEIPTDVLKSFGILTFEGDCFRGETPKLGSGSYKTDVNDYPKTIDFAATDATDPPPLFHGIGIFKLQGETMTVCLADPTAVPNVRPMEFVSRGGERSTTLIVLIQQRTTHHCGQ